MHSKTLRQAYVASLMSATVSAQCHDYVLVSARGTYELQGPSIGFKGMINTTLASIPNGIEYDVVYPAAPNQTAYLGADDINRYLTEQLSSCPQQKYALLGYSQGADATALALANFTDTNSAVYQAIRAVLVVGNPGHKPNATNNIDEAGGTTTRNATGPLYQNGNGTVIPEIYYSSGKLLDICFLHDAICGSPANQTVNGFPLAHLQYGATQSVQDEGAKFLIEKLSGNSTGGTAANGTATGVGSSPTSTTTSGGTGSATSPASTTSSGSGSAVATGTNGMAGNTTPNGAAAFIISAVLLMAGAVM